MSDASSAKKLSARAAAFLGTLALLVFLAAAGLVSELFLHGRVDLTRDRQFTLSRAARNTLRDLPDIVVVKAVMSRNLPPQFQQMRTQAMDLLNEFQARSNGKLKLVFEDPGEDPARRERAVALGVQEVELQEQSSDGVQVKKGFFGLALQYGDKKEVFPVLQSLESFEYDFVVKLKKLTGSTKTIGVLEGGMGSRFALEAPGTEGPRAATGFADNFPTLKAEIEKLYRIAPVDAGSGPIGPDIDLLLVAAPARLTEAEKFRIDQFVMAGKPVIFLAPGLDVNLSAGINALFADNGYNDLLAHYGMGVRANAVLEPQYFESVRFGNAYFPAPYPYWVVTTYNTLDAGSPITSSLQSLSFPWTSSLEIDTAGDGKDGARTEILVRTSGQSWEETGKLELYPRELNEYLPINPHSFPLAALKSGRFASFYAGRPLPAGLDARDSASFLAASRAESKVLVVSNALFATDFYLGYTNAAGNLHFLLNALDQLALDPELIRVRSRQVGDAPLDEALKTRTRVPLLWMNFLLAPLILSILGLFAALRRRNRESQS